MEEDWTSAQEWLAKTAGDTAEVNPAYGGFEIRILQPASFPWNRVFEYLLELGQEIWVERGEGALYIHSQPE